jgi:lipid-binding SYLF domain-containing protein
VRIRKEEASMVNKRMIAYFVALLLVLPVAVALADDKEDHKDERYANAIENFKNAGKAGALFDHCYGYAVFPRIAKGGVGIGAATGPGRVYLNDKAGASTKHVGNTRMTQASIGFQLGGKIYSMIIFFEDERAFKDFSSGNFAFGAEASAVAVTAGVSAQTSTEGGTSVGASMGRKEATTGDLSKAYSKGMATFTIETGGLMYEATLKGMKFSYKAL